MRRRAFLQGLGAATGTAFLPAAARAARSPSLDRLRSAGITVGARAAPWGASLGDGLVVALAAGLTARRQVASGTLDVRAAPVAGDPDAVDLLATFRARGAAPAGSLGVTFALDAWSVENYLLLPGCCYAGNRFQSRFTRYPPLLTEPADIGPHVPPIVTDIPRLNLQPGPSRLDVASADLATPALALFAPGLRLGLIILLDAVSAPGPTGLTVAESEDRRRATIEASTPFFADPGRGDPAARHPAPPPPHSRQSLTVRARAIAFACDGVTELNARLFSARKALAGARPRPGAREPAAPAFSTAFAVHEARANDRWMEHPGLLALGGGETAYTTWQNGWCGGLGLTWPLLAAGGPTSRERALRSLAFALEGQAPSGLFHAASDGRHWYDDGFTGPLPARVAAGEGPPAGAHPRWHLVRRTADTLFYLCKQLAWLERPNARGAAAATTPDPHWTKAARRAADGLAAMWERNRQLGQVADVETGELIVGGSSSAGLAPAALAGAADLLKEPRYLQVAVEAGRQFFERFVAAGLTCGGPGDALQCPDSESAAALLESFVTLYEATGDRAWIERARAAAHLFATWVFSADVPATACVGRGSDLRITGAVIADAQNHGGGPGAVLLSGDALLRLYRATGDRAFLELLRDMARQLGRRASLLDPQMVRASGSACAATEPELRPAIVPPDGVFDGIALLTYATVPSVYAQIDRAFVFAFDAVEARVKERMPARLVLSLRNPTAAVARVRVLAETSADADRPLPAGAVLDALTASVPAGGTVDVVVPPVGGAGR